MAWIRTFILSYTKLPYMEIHSPIPPYHQGDPLPWKQDFVTLQKHLNPKMILSRTKPDLVNIALSVADKRPKTIPDAEELLNKRDYTGALSHFLFQRQSGKGDLRTDLWIAYCAFHLGEYKRSLEEYDKLLKRKDCPKEVSLYVGCCQFFLGLYEQAKESAEKGPFCTLQNRLLFHVSHKLSDEKKLMFYHSKLQDILEDQLCLASIHYLRSHYQEAIDIYKRILLSHRNFVALNVYLALCYYKLDYYDVSLEVLQIYLQQHPDSVTALNLKACNHFKLYNGKAAEAELRSLQDQTTPSFSFARDIVKHNLVVFRTGEGSLQTLPPLVDVLPEARLNLVVYYLHRDSTQEAFDLMKDLDPKIPQEYILKGIVYCLLGQQQNNNEHLKVAQQYFQLVGSSPAECDTIPGRQCMASALFLQKQYEEVIVYLNSIKSYFYNDDTFNFNYGQTQAAIGNYKEAEEALLMLTSDKLKSDYVYVSTLARCYIMNKKARLAWELYLKAETSPEGYSLVQLIANDCYRMAQFYYAAKAFDVLERLDPNPEYWEGKRGACVGVFQMVIAGREPSESLRDVIQLLQNTSHPQVEYLTRVMRKWAKDNRIPL